MCAFRLILVLALVSLFYASDAVVPRPVDVAFRPDGRAIAVADEGMASVVVLDPVSAEVLAAHRISGKPNAVAWSLDGRSLWVGDVVQGRVIDVLSKNQRAIVVPPYPRGLALSPSDVLVSAGWATGTLDVHDLSHETSHRVPVCYQPEAVAITPNGQMAVVVPLIPEGLATNPEQAIAVRIVDVPSCASVSIGLPAGSTLGRGVAISPDGKWAVVSHVIGKAAMPSTHVDRGWINTDAISIIDISKRLCVASVLLDRLDRGAADPWGVAISADGEQLWVSIAGTGEVARIDFPRLMQLILDGSKDLDMPEIWSRIARDRSQRSLLTFQLDVLRQSHLVRYIPVGTGGARSIAISPDNRLVAVSMTFDGSVALIDAERLSVVRFLRWAPVAPPSPASRGERLFHDATNTFQGWLSCATCHPGARVDGLNWDLLNDGVGNPKNTRSLVLAQERAPVMSLGVRKDGPTAVASGLRYISFHEPVAEQAGDILAYLQTVRPERSPYLLDDGTLTPAAQRGKLVFYGKANCVECHTDPYGSNQRLYDVGTVTNALDVGKKVLTPMLLELWRTAPYLHDGSAASVKDVIVRAKSTGLHGDTADLTEVETDELATYLLSR